MKTQITVFDKLPAFTDCGASISRKHCLSKIGLFPAQNSKSIRTTIHCTEFVTASSRTLAPRAAHMRLFSPVDAPARMLKLIQQFFRCSNLRIMNVRELAFRITTVLGQCAANHFLISRKSQIFLF